MLREAPRQARITGIPETLFRPETPGRCAAGGGSNTE